MDPTTATFTSVDSYAGNIYEPASLHRYLYCNANPVKYADPSGNTPILNQVATMTISVLLATAATASAMGIISGLYSAANTVISGGSFKKVVTAFCEGFEAGAWLGASLGAITGLTAYVLTINIIQASVIVGAGYGSCADVKK